jgi:HEAT repeat protein
MEFERGRRPALPDLSVGLWTPEEFSLCFGADTIRVYHCLRQLIFLTDAELREVMLSACAALGRLFGATDCIVTSDFNAADHAFFKGMAFEAALQRAEPENGEVANLEDLYLDYSVEPDLAIDTPQGRQAIDRVWDSFGYWRFRWSPAIGADHPWPPIPRRLTSAPVAIRPSREVDPESLEGLLHDLRYEKRRKQEKAADALRELGPAARAAVPDLVEALGKRWPTVRQRVAVALGHLGGGAEVISALRRVLEQDEDNAVRQAAADALIRLGAGLLVLQNADEERRRRVADGLANLGPAAREVVPALLAMLTADGSNSRETRRTLARAVWLIGPTPDTIADLLRALRDPDELVRLWIARAFAVLGPVASPATQELVKALADLAEMVRSSLAWALARIGPESIAPVVKALRDRSPELRRGAAEALDRMRVRDAMAALEEAQRDGHEAVRQAADESLRRLAAAGRG